jgi:Flp pilus assembly pilin Flp
MMNFIKNFRKDEDGAVTVDWVVLTAAIVGLAIVAFSTIGDNTENLTNSIATEIGTVTATR